MIKKNISVEIHDANLNPEGPVLTFRSVNNRSIVVVDVSTPKLLLNDLKELEEAFNTVKKFGEDNPQGETEE